VLLSLLRVFTLWKFSKSVSRGAFRMTILYTRLSLILAGTLVMALLSACGDTPVNRGAMMTDPHYWQRTQTSSALLNHGPKAQQMLHRDLSHCVTELNELEKLGAVRGAHAGELHGASYFPPPNAPDYVLESWKSPDAYLTQRHNHLDYYNLDSCMRHKGWERMMHVPYNIRDHNRGLYTETIQTQQYRTKVGERIPVPVEPPGPYDNLN